MAIKFHDEVFPSSENADYFETSTRIYYPTFPTQYEVCLCIFIPNTSPPFIFFFLHDTARTFETYIIVTDANENSKTH